MKVSNVCAKWLQEAKAVSSKLTDTSIHDDLIESMELQLAFITKAEERNNNNDVMLHNNKFLKYASLHTREFKQHF